VLAWELATAEHPFGANASDLLARMTELMQGRVPSISRVLPVAGLDAVARRCMRADPAERYPSGTELLADLRALRPATAAVIVSAPEPPAPERLWWWQFHQGAIAALNCTMPIAAWAIRDWVRPYGSGIFLAILALATISVTLRLNLLFTSRVTRDMLAEQRKRLQRAVSAADAGLALLLLGVVAGLAGSHDAVAAVFVGMAVVTLASIAVIEPATTRAAGLDGLAARGQSPRDR
jgi:hypothetical protein